MTDLHITNLIYNPTTTMVSFTASFRDESGTTTVASSIRARSKPINDNQMQQLVDFRVAELLASPSLSGVPVSRAR